jgi:hypothetical protein
VRVSVPDSAIASPNIRCDVEIEFSGQKATYHDVAFQVATTAAGTRITGTIPATLSDFKIDPPSLLSIPVKNEMPIRVDMTWHEGS